MENRNLYKMDDLLIIVSYIMIVPIIVIAWPWISSYGNYENLTDFFLAAPNTLGHSLLTIGSYAAGALCSQITGRIIRFQEKQSLVILDTLNYYKKTTITQLASQLSMSESKISSLVKKMSRIPSLGIVFDGDNVTIDQKAESDMYAGFSSSPGSEQRPAEPSKPENSDKQKIKSFTDLEEQFEKLKNMDENQNPEDMKKATASFLETKLSPKIGGKKINIVLIIFLFMTPLWPLSLVYIIRAVFKLRKEGMKGEVK